MAINFASKKFGTKASSLQVTADGYEIGNLIADDNTLRSRGFRVEYFIKPPVDVTIDFQDPVDVSFIQFDCNVGCHQISAVELLATDELPSDSRSFETVGKAYKISSKKIVFKNGYYKPKGPYALKKLEVTEDETFRASGRVLSCVRALSIRITRMNGSGVAGLKGLGIYGQPAFACTMKTRKQIYNLAFAPEVTPKSITIYNEAIHDSGTEAKETNDYENHDEIPEEFLDSITYELMLLPMMLPSGHSVDRSTLDKLIHSENCKGRPGCDPFTGVPFAADRKPIPNNSLKIRIDAFLVKRATVLPVLARTVGGKPGMSQMGTSKLIENNNHSNSVFVTKEVTEEEQLLKKLDSMAKRKRTKENSRELNENSQFVNETKRLRNNHFVPESATIGNADLEHSFAPAFNRSENSELNNHQSERSFTSISKVNSFLSGCQQSSGFSVGNNPKSHEERISQSLDSSLKLVLNKIKKFGCGGVKATNNSCVFCHKLDQIFYALQCSHPICRECLLGCGATSKCAACQQVFTKKCAVRCHLRQ